MSTQDPDVELMKQKLFARQRHPLSVLLRVLVFFALIPAVWTHAWLLIIALGVIGLVGSFAFPPAPEHEGNFLSKAARGEQIWYTRASVAEKVILSFFSLFPTLALLWTLWEQMLWPSVLLGSLVMLHKVLLAVYMARLGEGSE